MFKRIIKFRNHLPLINLSLRCWFWKAAVHWCFSTWVLSKILQHSQENAFAGLCRPSFTEHLRWLLLNFCESKYCFSAESGIYCWQSRRLLLRTPLKTRVKPQKQSLELLFKRSALRQFANFTGKHLSCSQFSALLIRDSNTDAFLCNLQNF